MTIPIIPEAQIRSYRLEIRDSESDELIRTETFHGPTRVLTIEHADGRKDVHHVA